MKAKRAKNLTQISEIRDGFKFHGGHAALDLTCTLKGRLKTEKKELLQSPEDLSRWLLASGLSQQSLSISTHELNMARDLREAIFSIASSLVQHRPFSELSRKLINEMASGQGATPILEQKGSLRVQGPAQGFLVTLAQLAIQLLAGSQRHRIRKCESAHCAILFLDTSRAGKRRWCSMQGCGNTAKVKDFRKRQQRNSSSSKPKWNKK